VAVHRSEDVAAVVGLGHDIEAGRGGEHDPQAGAYERVVVDEQDADHLGRRARRTNAPSGSTYAGTALALWMVLPHLIGAYRITRRGVSA
jgi:hypothetical protein